MRDFFAQRSFTINTVKQNFVILALMFVFGQALYAQQIDPNNYHVTNETIRTKADGKLSVSLPTSFSGAVLMKYEYKVEGNFQKRDELKAKGGRISVDNLHPGKYFNIKFYDKSNNLLGLIDKFYLDYGVEVKATPDLRTLCGTLTFTDCNGNVVTRSGLETGKAYPITSATVPCGFEVSSTCTVTNIDYWHCLDGNLSAPGPYTAYDLTNYTGLGLTALAAARIAWIICNYGAPTTDTDPVSAALWYLTGTGGSANTVYNAAVNAVSSPNGTEVGLQFYRSPTGTTQDFVKWECPIVCNSTPLSLCGTNISKAYNISEIGLTCESPQRNLPIVLYVGNVNYQIKPNTVARLIEYTDGTMKAVLEVVKNNGTLGSVDLTRGYTIELTGSQKTTGTPASPWTAAVGCAPNTNNWTFYNTFQLKMCGTGINAGTSLLVTNPGEAMNHPLQIGTGANALRSNLGGGIWFGSFTGDFVFNLTEISLSPLTVNAGADATICYGQSKALTAVASNGVAPYNYVWSDGLANGANRTNAGTYTVTVTDNAGCTSTDAVVLTINPQLTLSMPNIDVCSGPNFLVTANASGGTPGYTYTWSGSLGTGNSKSLPTTNATYTVTVTDNKGCTAVDPFTVTVNPNPTVNISNDGPLTCTKTSVTLTATGGGTYAWSGGGTGATKVVTTAGTYTVTVTNTTSGCTAIASTVV
ncbi:MAG TPA: hypothetical protein PKD16_17840, partial [Saprospiraceae bacterium]|nr:hypothetical protein [Saprospiraceae bacterium]